MYKKESDAFEANRRMSQSGGVFSSRLAKEEIRFEPTPKSKYCVEGFKN